jgi:hypothetical protein
VSAPWPASRSPQPHRCLLRASLFGITIRDAGSQAFWMATA